MSNCILDSVSSSNLIASLQQAGLQGSLKVFDGFGLLMSVQRAKDLMSVLTSCECLEVLKLRR